MAFVIKRPPPDAREMVVDVEGLDGISRPRPLLRQNARHLYLYVKRDEKHVAIDKRDLLPDGMWDFHAWATAAAEAEGISLPEFLARMRAEMPDQLLASQRLERASQAPGPDLMEGPHASSSRDRGTAA